MSEPIQLDLRRDLPKVRERINYADMGACLYASPCAIGAMIDDEAARSRLDSPGLEDIGGTDIGSLVEAGLVSIPEDQLSDAQRLQDLFDGFEAAGARARFNAKLARLEAKYLPEQAA